MGKWITKVDYLIMLQISVRNPAEDMTLDDNNGENFDYNGNLD